MNWIERLNQAPGRVMLGADAAADVLQWAYSAHLPDNVPHRHAYFEVCLVGGCGAGEFRVEGISHEIGASKLFIARPGVIHQIVNTGPVGMELFWVAFQWSGNGAGEIAALAGAFADAETLVAADQGGRIGSLWRTLRRVAEPDPTELIGQDIQITSMMSALLIAIAQSGAGYPEPRNALASPHDARAGLARLAVHYVHDNLNRPLSVPEIAGQISLSPRHLTRLFVDFTGVAPAAYVEQARMDRSRSLLLRSDDPIKQVAALVGYTDVHHFTRVFTRRFGCPPGKYRRTNGASDTTPRGRDVQKPGALI